MLGFIADERRSWARPRLATLRQRSRAVADLVVALIGADELLLGAALALVAIGFSKIWLPGAYLVPGLVLLWIALPSRQPFIIHRPPPPSSPSEKVDRRKS